MKTLALLTTVAAMALAAPGAKAQSIPEKTGINSTLGISPSTQDFVTEAAMSDMLEIESSKLAQQKADASSKQFAAKMITDHTKTSEELKSLVQSGKVKADLPTALDKSHQDKLEKLKASNSFDKDYDSMQVSAHKDAVSLFERYGKSGDNDALKAFASKTLPTLQDHLKMAQDLEKSDSSPTVGEGKH